MTKRRTFIALSALTASLLPFKKALGQLTKTLEKPTTNMEASDPTEACAIAKEAYIWG